MTLDDLFRNYLEEVNTKRAEALDALVTLISHWDSMSYEEKSFTVRKMTPQMRDFFYGALNYTMKKRGLL